jgi:hypothetical protein
MEVRTMNASFPTGPGEGTRRFDLPRHPERPPGPWTADALAAELIWQDNADQPWQIIQERRLHALEEAVVSSRARRRLRRELRRRTRIFAWAGPDFRSRRAEDIGNEALCWREREGQAA